MPHFLFKKDSGQQTVGNPGKLTVFGTGLALTSTGYAPAVGDVKYF